MRIVERTPRMVGVNNKWEMWGINEGDFLPLYIVDVNEREWEVVYAGLWRLFGVIFEADIIVAMEDKFMEDPVHEDEWAIDWWVTEVRPKEGGGIFVAKELIDGFKEWEERSNLFSFIVFGKEYFCRVVDEVIKYIKENYPDIYELLKDVYKRETGRELWEV